MTINRGVINNVAINKYGGVIWMIGKYAVGGLRKKIEPFLTYLEGE